MLPMDDDRFPLTGCGTVAHAQMMRFHKHPTRGSGQSDSYTMTVGLQPSTSFEVNYDWDNMLYTYTSSATEQQRNAVALLMYHVGIANGRDFFTGSRHTTLSREQTFTNFFGYDRSIRRLHRIYYDDATWEAIIREQLDAGLPVYYWGNDPIGDHSFVVDGYDNTGRFHINWGWSGSQDGYYFLNELNPPRYEGARRFYNNQHIIINIKPDQGGISAGYEMALRNFEPSKISVAQNELFTISVQMQNVSYLDIFPGGQAGAALVDNNDNIISIIGIANSPTPLNPGSTRTLTINCFVPETVNPGQYRLRIVARAEGEDWRIVTKSAIGNAVPSEISFTVVQETSEVPGGGYGMALTSFTSSKTRVSQNELFVVSTAFRNVSAGTFPGGLISTALVDNNDNITVIEGRRTTGERNPGSTTSVAEGFHYVPDTIVPGQYRLMVVIRPNDVEEWRVATLSVGDTPNAINFTVTPEESATPGGGYGIGLEIFFPDKTSVRQNELFIVTSRTRNFGKGVFPGGQMGVALLDSAGNKVIVGAINYNALNPGSARNSTINAFVPENITLGQYYLQIVIRPTDNEEWRVATLALPDIPTVINFTVNLAESSATLGGGYGMGLVTFETSTTSVSRNEQFTVDFTLRNMGQDVFTAGQSGVALINNDGNIVDVFAIANTGLRNPGGTTALITRNVTIPNTVAPGQYQLRIVIRPNDGAWRIATLSLPDIPNSIAFEVR
jgi:hypothetical protein